MKSRKNPTPAQAYIEAFPPTAKELADKQQRLSDLETALELEQLATRLTELAAALVLPLHPESSTEEVACFRSFRMALYEINSAPTRISDLACDLDRAVMALRRRALRG